MAHIKGSAIGDECKGSLCLWEGPTLKVIGGNYIEGVSHNVTFVVPSLLQLVVVFTSFIYIMYLTTRAQFPCCRLHSTCVCQMPD